jgi:hypothetical protein
MNIAFKVNDKNKIEICEKIENTKLFNYIGKSRIDGSPMYTLNIKNVDRLAKIQKIKGEVVIYDKIHLLLNKISEDISYISTLDDYIKK